MKLALIIVFGVSLLSYMLFYLTRDQPSTQSMNLPWQVTVHDPMRTEVFGVVLNETTLQQAIQQFGKLDGIALYLDRRGEYSLEAYFGKVKAGPFGATLIATLDAPQQDLKKLPEHATKRVKTRDDSIKWTLKANSQLQQQARMIKSLTYIPDYNGLDQAYLLKQFGQPSQRQKVDETAELWFYPESGIRLMVDTEGKELFEYSAPAQFKIHTAVDAQH